MKELDFLPEWYKDRRRRHSLVRRQYIALAAVFLLMMAFNLTATHRATGIAAQVTRHEDQRMRAEAVVDELNLVTREINRLNAKASLVRQIDPRIDVAAILAEISHIVDESVVLSKIELVAEPFPQPDVKDAGKGASIRVAGRTVDTQQDVPLGNTKLRVVLAGVTVHSAHVADLVCKLDESTYFQQVRPSFYGKTKIQPGGRVPAEPQGDAASVKAPETLDVTAFEIACYLANYQEIRGQ